MTRQTRLIVVLLVLSIVGVGSLSFMASQYRKRMATQAPAASASPPGSTGASEASTSASGLRPDLPPAAAAAGGDAATPSKRVDCFLAARDAARAVCERYPVKAREVTAALTGDFSGVAGKRAGANLDMISTYKVERMNAFTACGMSYGDYAAVRAAWKTWKSGGRPDDQALAAALDAAKDRAAKADLGEFEPLDAAIK